MNARIATLLSAIVLASACEGDPGVPIESDVQNHREDCQDFVTNWGTIPWGDAGLSATYEHDFETSRFTIDVETASELELEVTQKGTNRHLDLVMAVYDPDGNKVGSDDDSGWGRYPRIKISADKIGQYEVRIDPKLPETEEGEEVEFVRGKYRVELTCLSDLCDVTAAQNFAPAQVASELTQLLDTAEDLPATCEGDEDEEYPLCTTQSAYAVRYTFNPDHAPDIEEAASIIKSEEYAYGYLGSSSRQELSWMLEEFNMTIDQIDALLGYSDYELMSLEIDDDCSPDYCEGSWFFLQSSARGEIHAIRLGYYSSHGY